MEPVTVYVDILLFVNLAVNGAILYASAALTGSKTSFRRMAAANVAASVYGFAVCLPPLGFVFCAALKSVFALIVSAIAFKTKSLRILIKNACIFLFCSFSYIAALLSVRALPFCEGSVYVRNSEIYFNLPVPVLLLAALVLLFAATVFGRITQKRHVKEAFCVCEISFEGKKAAVKCFRDSGNMLRDVITGDPVLIAERRAVKTLTGEYFGDVERSELRFRVIPYKTADGKTGLLPAFRPQNAVVDGKEKRLIVAVSDTVLGDGFDGIIGTE